MVTAIYSLAKVHGAELWLLFWFVCIIAYLSICFSVKVNRTKNGITTTLIGLLIAEFVTDITWALIYYRNSGFIDFGVGAVYGLYMWIPMLVITSIIVSVKNKRG